MNKSRCRHSAALGSITLILLLATASQGCSAALQEAGPQPSGEPDSQLAQSTGGLAGAEQQLLDGSGSSESQPFGTLDASGPQPSGEPDSARPPDCAPLGQAGSYISGYAAAGLDAACGWTVMGAGIQGVAVDLRDATGQSVASATTDAMGCYAFAGLAAPAGYTVAVVSSPGGMTVQCDSDGAPAGSVDVSLNTAGQSVADAYFGFGP
jgi:hypothetical protein